MTDNSSNINNNYFESFIFPYNKPKEIKLPTISNFKEIEINENDTDIIYLQKVCKVLNCKEFKTKYFDFNNHYNELLDFLKDYNNVINKFGFKLDLLDIEYNLKDLEINLNCDSLELEMESIYPLYCKMELALKSNINLMKKEIKQLENNKEIINYNKYKLIYDKLKNKEIDNNIIKTRAYENYKSRKIIKVLEEAIIKKEINNDPLKIILKEIIKNKSITINELEIIMGIDKLSTLKLIFILKNKGFINFDQENEIITPWTSNF